MTETRDITLGGRIFSVPSPLPLRPNRIVFPICRNLVLANLFDRVIESKGVFDWTDEEFDDLIKITFICAQTADPELTREQFEAMPVTPPELYKALFLIRYLTGVWVELPASGDSAQGEAQGAESPQT